MEKVSKHNFLKNCWSLSTTHNYSNYPVLGIFKAFIHYLTEHYL